MRRRISERASSWRRRGWTAPQRRLAVRGRAGAPPARRWSPTAAPDGERPPPYRRLTALGAPADAPARRRTRPTARRTPAAPRGRQGGRKFAVRACAQYAEDRGPAASFECPASL